MWTLDVNYLAVVVAAIVPMVVGALWYSPVLFSNAWLAAIGKTADEISAQANQVQAFSIAIAASLISAYVLAVLAALSGAGSILDGIILGLWAVVFIATASATWGAFEARPLRLWLINNGYYLVALPIMGAIIAVWP